MSDQIPDTEQGDTDDPHVPGDLLELYEVLEFTGKIPPPIPPPGEEGSGT